MCRDLLGGELTMALVGGLGLMTVHGPVDTRRMRGLLEADDLFLRAEGVPAQVVRYDLAQMHLEPLEVHNAVRAIVAESRAIAIPTALVIKPEDLDYWQRYSWLLASIGIVRAPCLSIEEGLAFARAEAFVDTARRLRRRDWVSPSLAC